MKNYKYVQIQMMNYNTYNQQLTGQWKNQFALKCKEPNNIRSNMVVGYEQET